MEQGEVAAERGEVVAEQGDVVTERGERVLASPIRLSMQFVHCIGQRNAFNLAFECPFDYAIARRIRTNNHTDRRGWGTWRR